jgi:hypothetical protein
MDFVCGLLRLAAQEQNIKAKNGLEERTDCVVLTHTKHIIQRHFLECKQFSAPSIFYFLRQDYRIFREEKVKSKNAVRRFRNKN